MRGGEGQRGIVCAQLAGRGHERWCMRRGGERRLQKMQRKHVENNEVLLVYLRESTNKLPQVWLLPPKG